MIRHKKCLLQVLILVYDYSGSYWYWIYDLLDPADTGTWRFTATFEGQTVTHEFAVGDLLLYGGFGDDA